MLTTTVEVREAGTRLKELVQLGRNRQRRGVDGW